MLKELCKKGKRARYSYGNENTRYAGQKKEGRTQRRSDDGMRELRTDGMVVDSLKSMEKDSTKQSGLLAV